MFSGVVSFSGPVPASMEAGISRAPGGGRSPPRCDRGANWQFASHSNEIESAAGLATSCILRDNSVFLSIARLDNRDELGARLALAPRELAQIDDGELLWRLYRRWGDEGVALCLGAFAFACWEPVRQRLTFGRDCLGWRSLYFYRGDGYVAFASHLTALLAIPDVPRQIDEESVADYLALNLSHRRNTLYRDVERVPSRTMVTIDRAGTTERHYWSPRLDAPPPYKRMEDYVLRARELLDLAVATAIRDTPQVAVSASGGLDSSAIAATAMRLGRSERVSCYSVVPPAGMALNIAPNKYLDERDKLEALSRMYPGLDVHYCVEGELHPLERDPVRLFLGLGTPIANPTNLSTYGQLYDAVAAAGHRALLVGNMGNGSLSWDGASSLLHQLRHAQFASFARDLHAVSRRNGRSLLRTFLGEVAMPAAPLHLRRQLFRLRGMDPDSLSPAKLLSPAYVKSELAPKWRARGYNPRGAYIGWWPARARSAFLFDEDQFARDYRADSLALFGFEFRDPLADRRLVEFLLTVPEPFYRWKGVPRSFARMVLADRLPKEIVEEQRRGSQSVTWFRRLNARRSLIAAEVERLEASPLASRILDMPRLKRLLDEWPADEAAAELRRPEYGRALNRGVHVGSFIRWVEGGNA